MTNDDRWLLAVVVVECAAAAMVVVVNSGDSGRRQRRRRGARWTQARADEGTRARAMVDMADDNGKQQKRASDDGAARRRSSKINDIGVTSIPVFCFLMLVCAHSQPKYSGSRVTQL